SLASKGVAALGGGLAAPSPRAAGGALPTGGRRCSPRAASSSSLASRGPSGARVQDVCFEFFLAC
ncbi:unnamed protein product, partial [Urochloa humidicola]